MEVQDYVQEVQQVLKATRDMLSETGPVVPKGSAEETRRGVSLHEALLEQVRQTPDPVAVAFVIDSLLDDIAQERAYPNFVEFEESEGRRELIDFMNEAIAQCEELSELRTRLEAAGDLDKCYESFKTSEKLQERWSEIADDIEGQHRVNRESWPKE